MADVKVTIPRGDSNPNQRTDIDVEVVNSDGSVSSRTVKGAVQANEEDGTVSIGILASAHVPFAGGGEFSPADVTGLAAWYDATQITGLADGDTVATWADLSGNGITMTGYGTPAYRTSGMNGKPAVEFYSGHSEFFSAASSGYLELTGDFLILAAVKFLTVGAGQRTIVSKRYQRWELMEYSAKIGAFVGGTSNSASSTTTVAINTEYVVGLRRTATSALSVRLDGTQDGTATNSAFGTGGTAAHIGARPGDGLFYNGHIGEVIIYDQDVSPGDLAALEAYMADKWLP